MPTVFSPIARDAEPSSATSASLPSSLPPSLLLPLADACARGCALTGALAAGATGAAPGAPSLDRVRNAAARLGRAAAHAGLTPDALLLLLDDEVHARLAAAGAAGHPGPDRGAADAVVIFLWGGARDTYHAARAALDARARRRAGRSSLAALRGLDAA